MARTRSLSKKVDKKDNQDLEPTNAKSQPKKGQSRASTKKVQSKNAQQAISAQELKTHIQTALKRQILGHVPKNPIMSDDGIEIEQGAKRDGTEMAEEIGTANWLDWQHVYGLIPSLVAQREHLYPNVGVFPAYSFERMSGWLRDAAQIKVWQQLGLPTKITANNDVVLDEKPLISDSEIKSSQQRAAKKRTQTKRNNDAKRHQAQAQALLDQNNFNENTAFQLYLDAIGESQEHFLGNPKNRSLKLDDCEQLIVPFHMNNNHYTVAVIHFTEDEQTKIAEIKYYDSNGSDLDETLKNQLISYCQSLGFETRYTCASQHDQREGHNCSMFASFKAIDIANANVNNPERFLSDLTSANYNQVMIMLRYSASLMIKAFGQNVAPSDELTKVLKDKIDAFEKLSEYVQKVTELNQYILDLNTSFESVLEINSTALDDKKPLSEVDPSDLLAKYTALYKQAKEKVSALQSKDIGANEKEIIAKYTAQIQLYEMACVQIQSQIKALKGIKQSLSVDNASNGWLSSWKNLALAMPILALGIFLGVPFLASLFLKMGVLLPSNAIIPMIGGALIFMTGSWLVNMLFGSHENPAKAQGKEEDPETINQNMLKVKDVPQVSATPDVIEIGANNKSLTTRFDLTKEGEADDDVVIVKEVKNRPHAKPRKLFQ